MAGRTVMRALRSNGVAEKLAPSEVPGVVARDQALEQRPARLEGVKGPLTP